MEEIRNFGTIRFKEMGTFERRGNSKGCVGGL